MFYHCYPLIKVRSEIIPGGPDLRYYFYLVLIYFATKIIYKDKKHNADCDKANIYMHHNHDEVISEVLTTRISGVFNICFSVSQYS